ncbi:MAG TPA: hypothetical protein VMY42_00510 [Thermoguttaceae bacterium]|nr:hypothetical protein [Thermoguttaceae bacterium]
MTPNPILKVLSTLGLHRVRYLLMGGQACVLYGAAEFSRDTDIAIAADPENLGRLSRALAALQADCIAVPALDAGYLARGHAVHFRCRHPEAHRIRIDVMSVMRGVAPFEELWQRRTTLEDPFGTRIEMMALPDLVHAKKTQRDKDWPMIRRLIEANFVEHSTNPTPEQIDFWLRESRTPAILLGLAERYPDRLAVVAEDRPLLRLAVIGDEPALTHGLESEEKQQRDGDRDYWVPLRAELEKLRREKREIGEQDA